MKNFNKLLCAAIVVLWVVPASALDWDLQARAVLNTSGPELESFELLSSWIATDVEEYEHFFAADYQLHFELFNATLDSQTGTLRIDAFDETGTPLATNTFSINYTVDTSNVPFILTIEPGTSQSRANSFVNFLSLNEPDTRRVQFTPEGLDVSVQDCDQQVRMRSWFRYDQAQVATDEPDDMVVPSVFTACP